MMIEDHRGKRVETRGRLEMTVESAQPDDLFVRMRTLIGFGLVLLTILAIILNEWAWAVPFLAVTLGVFFIKRDRKVVRSNAGTHHALERRRCPSCGYDLRALPVDERDGCCVCPECGGAWRVTG